MSNRFIFALGIAHCMSCAKMQVTRFSEPSLSLLQEIYRNNFVSSIFYIFRQDLTLPNIDLAAWSGV